LACSTNATGRLSICIYFLLQQLINTYDSVKGLSKPWPIANKTHGKHMYIYLCGDHIVNVAADKNDGKGGYVYIYIRYIMIVYGIGFSVDR